MKKKAKSEFDDDEALLTGINVTPLVDVCLVLVIIFMVTAPLLSNPAFNVDLPKAKTQEGEEKDKTTLSLSKDGRYALDDLEIKDLKELSPKLKEKLATSASRLVILRADEGALNGDLTELMAVAKDAGALSMTIATLQKK